MVGILINLPVLVVGAEGYRRIGEEEEVVHVVGITAKGIIRKPTFL
jgi:hypothetical protein